MGRSRKIIKTPKKIHGRKTLNRRIIIEKMGYRCHWCGVMTDDSIYNDGSPRATTIDHRYNKLDHRRHGNDDKVVVACWSCNQIRSRTDEIAFGSLVTKVKATEIHVEYGPEPIPTQNVEEAKIVISPVIRGPKIIVDVPRPEPLSRWRRFINWVSKFFTRKG